MNLDTQLNTCKQIMKILKLEQGWLVGVVTELRGSAVKRWGEWGSRVSKMLTKYQI